LFISERDAFDTLFDHAPDKLNLVKKVKQVYSGSLIFTKLPPNTSEYQL